MNQKTIADVVEEINETIVGHPVGKIFQLTEFSLAIDFRLLRGTYLFLSVDPKAPRIYLIERRLKELEKQSVPPSYFAQHLRRQLAGARVEIVTKNPAERVVQIIFAGQDKSGETHHKNLVAQLTGRSANLFLLDSTNEILLALRSPKGKGQQIGELYQPPPTQSKESAEEAIAKGESASMSAALDAFYAGTDREQALAARVKLIESELKKQVTQRTKLRSNLLRDRESHGDADRYKRYGDLLLANVSSAKRVGGRLRLVDYFAEGTPEIEIEVDEHSTPQEAANEFFQRYAKAKRAAKQIELRLEKLEEELAALRQSQADWESVKASGDESRFADFEETKPKITKTKTRTEKISGVRAYRSSDGYEILVGRSAQTNDQLTFRVAKPNDMWFHAADYPGSHVVIRNSSRADIPHRTIVEAAQLAAKFSQAGSDSKVVIHYTPRKFLSKPKGAAPGLVRMSRVRSMTVQPAETIERIKS